MIDGVMLLISVGEAKKMFFGNQSVSYSNDEPLMILKGEGIYLFDENGTKYLDIRDNVGNVGWQRCGVEATN